VTFEPSSILKKESSFSDNNQNLAAVSNPADFQFDDELDEPDQAGNFP